MKKTKKPLGKTWTEGDLTYREIQGQVYWWENVEQGWLETDADWAPTIVPLDFSNTLLFDAGHQWVGVSRDEKEIWEEGYGKPWVVNYDKDGIPAGTRFEKAYCHYDVRGRYDPKHPDWGPYSLWLHGGDDFYCGKIYSTKEEALDDLALLKTGVISYADIAFIGLQWGL